MFSRGHAPGVYYYHGKNGKILVNDKNKEEIKKDAEELSKKIFNSEWICPQAMLETPIEDKIINNSPNNNKDLLTNIGKKLKKQL
jgi:hypothetical protein